jgi:hypothetical protein
MYYVQGEPLRRFNKKFTALIASLAILMNGIGATLPFVLNSSASASTIETIYNSIPSPLPSNLPSQGYQATSTKALGDKIAFLPGSSRNLTTAEFTMSSWACETGSWNTSCTTSEGATFNHPITLNLYNTGAGDSAGSLIQSVTQTFAIPYRPSADSTCADTRQWKNSTGSCFNGITHNIIFDLSGITVPDTVIYSVEFNTMSYGNTPLGVTGPYDSLNLALTTDVNAPYIGTDIDTDGAYWDSTYLGRPAGLSIDTGWAPYKIAAKFNAIVPSTTTVTVTGNTASGENQPGWLFNRDVSTSTPYEFNSNQHSIGTGSLNVLPIGATPANKMVAENFLNTPVADVHSVKYDFKIGAGGTDTQEEQFYMNVYANFGSSSPTKFYDCRYNVVPVVGSTSGFTTVIFDPAQTYPVATSGSSPYPCPTSPDGMNALSAGSRIRMFALNVGDTSASDTGLDGYLDNVVVRTTSAITVYDFEPFVNNAPVVTFASPTPAEGSIVTGGTITPHVLATDDYGMGSYYIRLWKGAFESGLTNLVSNNCSSAPGAFLLGTNLDITCPAIDTATLTDGTYVLSAQFLDGHIVWGQALRTFTVDKTAPTVPSNLLWTPNGGSVMGSAGVTNVELGTLNWDNSDTDVDRYKYYFWTDIPGYFYGQANAWSTEGETYIVESPTGGSIWTDFADKEGTYYFCIKAIDAVGNSSACSDTFSVTYDATAPTLPVHQSPTNNALINYNDFWFEWSDSLGAVSYETQYSQNPAVGVDGSFQNVQWSGDYQNVQPTDSKARSVGANGTWYWQVRALDAAGNKSAWTTPWEVTIDMVAPNAPTLLSPADSVAVKGANLVNDWQDVSDAAYYIYTSYNVDSSGNCINSPIRFTDNYIASNTNTRNVGTLTFCWEVRAVDTAGNVSSPSARWKTIVDNDMPIVSIIGSGVSGNMITPDVSASDASSPLTYVWSTVPEVAISNTSAQEPTFTVNVDGTYNFTLTATDTAGNSVVVPFSFTYTTPAAPPVDDENEEETPPPAVQGATTTPPPAPTTAFTNVTTTNNNNETQEVPVTEGGNTEQETSGVVEGTTTENFANTADDAVKTAAVVDTNNFLGLGWWWLAVLAAIAGLLWFLLGKDKEENEAE